MPKATQLVITELGLRTRPVGPQSYFKSVTDNDGSVSQLSSEEMQLSDLLNVAFPHLQHGQVVVGLRMVVVVDQGQPEALMGQVCIPYSLKRKVHVCTHEATGSPRHLPPPILNINLSSYIEKTSTNHSREV